MDPIQDTKQDTPDANEPQKSPEQEQWAKEVEQQLQDKEHIYKDKIQQFFKSPALPEETIIGPSNADHGVTLEPEHSSGEAPAGEPLFAESAPEVPETSEASETTETAKEVESPVQGTPFQQLIEEHLEQFSMPEPKAEESVPAPVEVTPEPVVEPSVEPTPEPTAEHVVEPIPEPVIEEVSIVEPTPIKEEPVIEIMPTETIEVPVEPEVVEEGVEDSSIVEPVEVVEQEPIVEQEQTQDAQNSEVLEKTEPAPERESSQQIEALEQLHGIFAEIDPQKALEKREYTAKELAEAEEAFHVYAASKRAASVDIADANEEFQLFTETHIIDQLLKKFVQEESSTEDRAKLVQQITDDFFMFQDPRPIRYLLEYFIGISTKPGQVEYYPYIDYRVMVKRPLLVCMILDAFFSILPTESPALLLSIQDEIYQDRKKYVRFTFECAAHSKIQKRYQEIQPLMRKLMDTVRARFGLRVLDHKVQMVLDFSFTVKKDE